MYSLNNLKRRYSRTGLTITGITLAISLMVIMFSIGNGVRDSARSILDEAGVDIFCQANGTSISFMLGEIDNGRELARSMMGDNNDIRTAYPVFVHTMYGINESIRQAIITTDPADIENLTKLAKDMDIESVYMNGIIPELVGGLGGVDILEGPGFTRGDDPFYAGGTYDGGTASPNFTHEIEINKVLADKLELKIGDMIYVNNKLPSNVTELGAWLVNVTAFRVVVKMEATWEAMRTSSGYVHLSELQYLAGRTNDTVHQILVDLHDPTKDQKVKDWIEETYPELEAFTIEDFLGEIEEITAVFRGFGEIILLITGVIAIMFTSTVMIISIRERTSEIAALRAIGFSKRSIFSTIVAESFIMILIGFAIGLLIGIGLAYLLDGYLINLSSGGGGSEGLPAGFHFVSITWLLFVQMGVVAMAFGLLCGLIPAAWASRLNIVETLKKG